MSLKDFWRKDYINKIKFISLKNYIENNNWYDIISLNM